MVCYGLHSFLSFNQRHYRKSPAGLTTELLSDLSSAFELCSPRESELVCFTGVALCVCLSVTMITKKILDRFVLNFMGRFLGEGKTKFVFRYDL